MTTMKIDAFRDTMNMLQELCSFAVQFGCKFAFHSLSCEFEGGYHTFITLSKGKMSWIFVLGNEKSSFRVSRVGELLCNFSFGNELMFTQNGDFNGLFILMLLFYTVESTELLLDSAKNVVYKYVSESTFECVLPRDTVVPLIAKLRQIWCESQDKPNNLRTPETVYVPDYATVEDYILAMHFVSLVCLPEKGGVFDESDDLVSFSDAMDMLFQTTPPTVL